MTDGKKTPIKLDAIYLTMDQNTSISSIQRSLCEMYKAPFLECDLRGIVGISPSVKAGIYPIHGLRHPLEGNGTGWFIWSGEYSDDPNFFAPLHYDHLSEYCPGVIRYLGLGPGWRFLHTPDYEDVWEDRNLLIV
jgi:hypothetical protein